MSIAEQITQLKQDFDEVKQAGYDEGYADGQAQGGGSCQCTWKDTFKEFLEYKNRIMASLFQGTTFTEFSFKDYDDTAGATNATNMFTGNKKLTTVTPFNTSNVTTMATMFADCAELTAFTGFDTKKCTNFFQSFRGCSSLTTVSIDVDVATNLNGTFNGCTSLTNVSIGGYIKASVSFADSPLLTTGEVGEATNSVQNIIDALIPISDGEARTITFHAEVMGKLTPEQVNTIKNVKGWSLIPE